MNKAIYNIPAMTLRKAVRSNSVGLGLFDDDPLDFLTLHDAFQIGVFFLFLSDPWSTFAMTLVTTVVVDISTTRAGST